MDAHNFFAADDDDLIIINRQGLTDRPTVTLLQDDFVNAAEEVEALLRATCPFLFRRGNRLVVPAYREAKASDDTVIKTCNFVEVAAPLLQEYMSLSARFRQWKGSVTPRLVSIDPPAELAIRILSRSPHWQFAEPKGILLAPTIDGDGRIVSQRGYDRGTGFYLAVVPKMPPIPDRPTKADAEAALQLLKDLLQEFPFEGGCDDPKVPNVKSKHGIVRFDHAGLSRLLQHRSGPLFQGSRQRQREVVLRQPSLRDCDGGEVPRHRSRLESGRVRKANLC